MAAGFLFDLNRCTGCQACAIACTIENGLDPGGSWRRIVTFNEARHPAAPEFHLSLACNHCAEAPCMTACPALAIRRDAPTGAVLIDRDACIGCRYCVWACPYEAPRYDAASGVTSKCTLCAPRLERGLEPACAAHCPTGALGYGALEGEGLVEQVPGCPTHGIGPAIRFTPLKPDRERPDLDPVPGLDVAALPAGSPAAASGITLRAEWPLAAFTLIAACLVAAVTAAAAGALRLAPETLLAAAGAGMALAAFHLGRPGRAWRAVLNLRRSWLSREVVLYGAFAAVAALWLEVSPANRALGLASAAVGIALLFAIDRVYDVTDRSTRGRLHSADVVLTGPFLAALLIGSAPAAALFGAAKLALYLRRALRRARSEEEVRSPAAVIRLGVGLAAPLLLWILDVVQLRAAIVGCALVGEIIDRCQFYGELELRTPRREMERRLIEMRATRGRDRSGPAYLPQRS